MDKVYKVVREFPAGSGLFYSCTIHITIHIVKYRLQYFIGQETRALKNTLGIMVFETYKQAARFVSNLAYPSTFNDASSFKVLEAAPIGEPTKPEGVCNHRGSLTRMNMFYESLRRGGLWATSSSTTSGIPQGTICYPAIKVLKIVGTHAGV